MPSTSNPALKRSIYSLAHPLTILVMLLLLFNDHWLRWHYPSWLTGKLGDVAWLIFAPLIAAVLFSLLIPKRLKQQERYVGLTAFAVIGLWFILGKTVPLIHTFTINALQIINGYPAPLRMDATDLLTLPALLIGWRIWIHAHSTPYLLRPMAYALLMLGIMLTLANSPARAIFDYGIQCILEQDGQIFAGNLFSPGMIEIPPRFYMSKDSGETWTPYKSSVVDLTCSPPAMGKSFSLTDPTNAAVQYRFKPGVSIERSTDSGHSWTVEMDLSELAADAHRIYLSQKEEHNIQGVIVADPGPFDAAYDPLTGNLLVAMGQEGILTRHTDGDWQWVTVGSYYHLTAPPLDKTLQLLSRDLILAVVLGLLSLGWWLPTARLGCAALFWLTLSWLCWVIALMLQAPTSSTGLFDLSFFTIFPAIVSGITGLIFVTAIIVEMAVGHLVPKKLRFRLILTALNVMLFVLPYVLWSQGTIPYHETATLFSLLLTGSIFFGGSQYLELFPKLKNKKNDETESDLVTKSE